MPLRHAITLPISAVLYAACRCRRAIFDMPLPLLPCRHASFRIAACRFRPGTIAATGFTTADNIEDRYFLRHRDAAAASMPAAAPPAADAAALRCR